MLRAHPCRSVVRISFVKVSGLERRPREVGRACPQEKADQGFSPPALQEGPGCHLAASLVFSKAGSGGTTGKQTSHPRPIRRFRVHTVKHTWPGDGLDLMVGESEELGWEEDLFTP